MSHEERWRLTNKRALVTGGTKGIGYAIADELLRLGAAVTVVARTANAVEEAVAQWERNGLLAQGIRADVSTAEGIAAVVAKLDGSLDILVNNVGTNIRKTTLEYTNAEYRNIIATNLDSVFAVSRALYPLLSASDAAAVVNIGSVAGSVAVLSGLPYALSKAGLDQMTRYLAVEWAPAGIRVNSVNPWYTRTPLAAPRLEDPAFTQKVLEATPLRRIAEPEDIAAAAAFLCLPAARHITGQTIAVDGGFLAQGLV